MENRGGNHRTMPTFNDKFGLRDRLPSEMFGEARRHLHDDVFGRAGATMDWPSHGFGDRLGSMGRDFGANFDSLCRQFHDLRPRVPAREEFGSCDSLDEDSARSLILEDTRSKSRTFEVSFNVREYVGGDVTVRVRDDTLTVSVQQQDARDGRGTRQFTRQVTLPSEVDSDMLSSVLSGDGILTVYAPMPPAYNNVAFCRNNAGAPRVNTPDLPEKFAANPESPRSPDTAGIGVRSGMPTSAASPKSTTRFAYSPRPMTSRAPHAAAFLYPNDPRRTCSDSTGVNDRSMSHGPNGPRSASPFQTRTTGFADEIPMDEPVYATQTNGLRRMKLRVDIGPVYKPDDIVVNVDDLKLTVNAVHEDVRDGVVSKTSLSRQFDLKEPLDGDSVEANLSGGVLTVTALAQLPSL